jgi:hypothetical protein
MSQTVSPFVNNPAMTLGQVQSQFQAILDRTDCDDTLAQTFLLQAFRRVERELRLPCMERFLVIQPQSFMNAIDIPVDLIQPIDILVESANGSVQWFPPALSQNLQPGVGNTYVPLTHLSYRDLLKVPTNDIPKAYGRAGSQFHLRGWIPPGVTTMLMYYGAFTPITDLNQANELTASAPDLAIYAALSLAGDYFQIEAAQAWEARYQQMALDVQKQASDADWSGGPMSMQPAYGAEFD